jgi:peptidyl-prolyl cis-trans isomerase D
MLQEIREKAQGWFAWAIVVLISIPFALWGIQEYLGVGKDVVVAEVNGQEIKERDLDLLAHRARSDGNDSERSQLDRRKEVLDAMVVEMLVVQAADAMKLRAGDDTIDATIHSLPGMMRNGRFDDVAYQQELGRQGLSDRAFRERVQRFLVIDQISEGIRGSAFVTDNELRDALRLESQKRDVGYLVVPTAQFAAASEPTDTEIKAYYDANRAAYLTPERVKIQYLELDAKQLVASIKPEEDAVKAYFEQHRDEYAQRAQRRARHILITADAAAAPETVEAARQKAQQAIDRIRAGEPFAAVARELSDDPGSAEQGGDLGSFERGVMVKEFEEAAFGLPPHQLSEPVRSPFGFHVIEVTEVRESAAPTFEAARARVEQAVRQTEAERLYYEQVDRLSDLVFENAGSLEPAAQALDRRVQSTDWLGREGGPGVLSNPKVIAAAFSEEVRGEGRNSDPVDLGAEHTLVLRVVAYEEPRPRSLDEVRNEVREHIVAQKSAAAARTRADALLGQARAGAALDTLAKEAGSAYERVAALPRRGGEAPDAVARKAFAMPRPAPDKPSYAVTEIGNGDAAVVGLYGVADGEQDADGSQAAGLRAALGAQAGAQDLVGYRAALQGRAKLKVRPLASDSARPLD